MSKGSGGGTQVTRVEPSTLQSPYLSDIYRQAQALPTQQFFPGTTFARPSEETQLAQEMQRQAALGQQTAVSGSLLPAFQGALMSPAQMFTDPLLQQSLAAGLRPYEESASRLLTQARRDAFEAGQGSGDRRALLESEVIGDYLTKAGDVTSQFYGNIYGDALKTRAATLGLAPDIMRSFLTPAATIADIGKQKEAVSQAGIDEAMRRFAFEQAAPSQALSQYANIVGGSILPGSTTTTGGGGGPSDLMKGVGGALTGAALGAPLTYSSSAGLGLAGSGTGFMSTLGPYGAAAGALIGLLS